MRTGRRPAKLFVIPATAIADGTPFTVTIRYRGRPKTIRGIGWIETDDGALVASEPAGAPGWIPCNASLGRQGHLLAQLHRSEAAEGDLERPTARRQPPRAQAHLALGRGPADGRVPGNRRNRPLPHLPLPVAGLPSIVAIDPREGRSVPKGVQAYGGILALFQSRFGAYPFDSVGAIIDHFDGFLGLETQTRPVYNLKPKGGIHAHELAHQWFGDSVGFARWQDIWLAEGFAQWSMWLLARPRRPAVAQVQLPPLLLGAGVL